MLGTEKCCKEVIRLAFHKAKDRKWSSVALETVAAATEAFAPIIFVLLLLIMMVESKR
jgi:hypothetical protein